MDVGPARGFDFRSWLVLTLAILLFPIFLLPTSVWAADQATDREADQARMELVSYAELMALPLAKRETYINGVREILVEIAKQPNGRFSDSDPELNRSKLKAWLEFIDDQLGSTHSAQAEGNIDPTRRRAKNCRENKDCLEAMIQCHRKAQMVTWSSGSYSCQGELKFQGSNSTQQFNELQKVLIDPMVSSRLAESLQQHPETAMESARTGPPAASVSQHVPVQSQKSLADMIKSSPPAASKGLFDKYKSNESIGMSVVPNSPATMRTAPSLPAPEASLPLLIPKGTSKVVQSQSVRVVPAKPNSLSPEEIKKPAPPAEGLGTNSVKGTITVRSANIGSCQPVKFECGDPKEVREKIFQGNLSCVFAGMVSKLDLRNRRCAPVMEFKVGDRQFKCKEPGQTMCNPLLFGSVSESEAICVGHGHGVTLQCSKLSGAHDAERFLNRNQSGLQDRWEEFREGLAKVCKVGTVEAKFHCHECAIMRTRMLELYARVVGNPCDAPGTLEDGMINRVKSGPVTK